MANRLTVSFGLSGPVTQPTSDVPGGAGGGGAGGATGFASGTGWAASGTTAACCSTCPTWESPGICPRLGSAAPSFVPVGR